MIKDDSIESLTLLLKEISGDGVKDQDSFDQDVPIIKLIYAVTLSVHKINKEKEIPCQPDTLRSRYDEQINADLMIQEMLYYMCVLLRSLFVNINICNHMMTCDASGLNVYTTYVNMMGNFMMNNTVFFCSNTSCLLIVKRKQPAPSGSGGK